MEKEELIKSLEATIREETKEMELIKKGDPTAKEVDYLEGYIHGLERAIHQLNK